MLGVIPDLVAATAVSEPLPRPSCRLALPILEEKTGLPSLEVLEVDTQAIEQVFIVIIFWLWRIVAGNSGPPRILFLTRANRFIQRFTPWQIVVSTLTAVYTVRNFDKILGLGSPEPLSRLYSPSYYRATWINTGLDTGFATAMSIRPKWLRDICSIIFSAYYILYPNEAEEKLRRFRAVPTVEMLRTTWEKTTNPYIRLFTYRPHLAICRKILLPRPKNSSYHRPITAWLFSAIPEARLSHATELILDYPGGGFVAMTPEHHEERLRLWALASKRPVLSIDYGKAPEYPYPFAIDEGFDAYKVLVESGGALIGMSGKNLKVIVTADSAGATIGTNVIFKVLEHNAAVSGSEATLQLPLACVFSYAALDFNFTSWMSESNLRVLRSEQSSGNLPGLRELAKQKDHLKHISPLSMVGDKRSSPPKNRRNKRSRSTWKETFRGFTSSGTEKEDGKSLVPQRSHKRPALTSASASARKPAFLRARSQTDTGVLADSESDEEEYVDFHQWKEEERPLKARVKYISSSRHNSDIKPIPLVGSTLERQQLELSEVMKAEENSVERQQRSRENEPIGTRLTMTSRTGYFQDRTISPSMMRAMAILYIGPYSNPDFTHDYHISPILAPDDLLIQFPPLLMHCGEKDPFVDDTVIFAGRLREAKRARKVELDLALSGKSARFGEKLRMSVSESPTDPRRIAFEKERDKLASQSEEDWVQVVLFSEWSHGYLQMLSILPEAKAVIEEVAEWMDDAFGRLGKEPRPEPTAHSETETETDDSGITFVPKKYQGHSRTGSFSSSSEKMANSARTNNGSPAKTVLAQGYNNTSDSDSDTDRTKSVTATPNGTRQTGQKISETELMRRRRLLDSHIFE